MNPPTVYTNARIKEYPSTVVKQVATGPIFPLVPGETLPRTYAVSPPGEAKDPERSMDMSQQRARSKVRDIALCNDFQFFCTWTIDPALLDRYDPKLIYRKLRTFLSHAVSRKGFAYVLVPEYHRRKPGEDKPALHLHGLCSLGKVRIERARGKSGRRLTDKVGRPVYNMLDWKYGFSDCVPLDENRERTANYITGYITQGSEKIFGKWYLHSRGLATGPNIIPLPPENYDRFRDREKLNAHIQCEFEVYNGLRVLSEEFPKV